MGNYTKTLPYELGLTSRVLQEAAINFFEQNKFPITVDEFAILDCIYINPNIIQIQLAKLILKGRSHTGKLLKSLEEKNLVARTPIKQNSKIVMRLKITDKGMKIYKEISSKIEKLVGDIDSSFSLKIDDLIKMLQTIRKDAEQKFDIKFD